MYVTHTGPAYEMFAAEAIANLREAPFNDHDPGIMVSFNSDEGCLE